MRLTRLGEDCFMEADKFVPERWYKRTEMILNRAAYAPFGTGERSRTLSMKTYSCD